ncbi:hypothetical protein LINPERPRIM_LOCUS4568 [Linum perenne]
MLEDRQEAKGGDFGWRRGLDEVERDVDGRRLEEAVRRDLKGSGFRQCRGGSDEYWCWGV